MNQSYIEILRKGVKKWNEWRLENREKKIDLSNLTLTNESFQNMNFVDVNLSYAKLSGVNFGGADLSYANLRGADLSGAFLRDTNFTGSVLAGANLTKCELYSTIFGLTDLASCKGLDTVKVAGECIIDFHTLQNFKTLPKGFLRKIGLPEVYIDYLPEFRETPINLFPVFLSHSKVNKDFAEKLYEALIDKGVKVWYDQKQIMPGDIILEHIDKGINLYDKMIIICSKQVFNSWWIKQELERIFEKERQYEKQHGVEHSLLIPITIDNTIFYENNYFAKSIRNRNIGNFQEWQDDEKFNIALKKLISALNVDRRNKGPESFLLSST